jgi:hypothetical protein
MKQRRNRTGWGTSWLRAGLLGLTVVALATILVDTPARADDATQAVSAARLSSVDGQVRLSQGDQAISDQAAPNAPLFEGTRVATAENGRAEIQFVDGSVARLSPNSSLTLTVLHGQGGSFSAEIVLETGLGYFELQGGAVHIRFGDSAITAGGFSVLRINLDNPPGELAVFSGNAHVERGSTEAADVHGGESLMLSASDPSHFDLTESIEPDSWDTWNSDRDQVLTAEASSKTGATQGYADGGNPAWNDLDANGNWYNVPGQGNIWSPYAASGAGWDPYGSGYWMWTPRFGYIWVSGYSWGYMPFQCGSWNFYDSFGWGWAPGLGGCTPWWGGGYFGPNIGFGYGGYRPPIRPRPHPISPIGHGGPGGVHPMLAVNRITSGGIGLPPRDRAGSVVIAGHTVQAFRPLSPRPQYDRSASSGFQNRTQVTSPAPRSVNGSAGSVGPNYGVGRSNSSTSATWARPSAGNAASQHAATPSRAPSGGYSGGGSSASHPSGSSGGSSGGSSSASHSSGGGSPGGSGGGSHSGGGGSHR